VLQKVNAIILLFRLARNPSLRKVPAFAGIVMSFC
jgi:hypothetical protein